MSPDHQVFEFKSPRAMLEKARRELEKLRADRSTDNFFNLVITTNHIRDYAKKRGLKDHQLPGGDDFQRVRDLANMAKHLGGRDKEYIDNNHSQESVKLWADGIWAEGIWDGKEAVFEFNGERVDILKLAETVINAWDEALKKQGIW